MTHKIEYYKTSAGIIKISLGEFGINSCIFTEEKVIDISGNTVDLTKLNLIGTDFQIKVWQAALKIPIGKTVTYQELANEIGFPKAHRAVANALANNKIAYFVPCHRIIRKDGKLGGYKWGIEKKIMLLKAEKAI